jgi:tyrosine-protein kinase Etk/Wzc
MVVSPDLAQRISLLSQTYDHLIIDTPPVLAFPDALIWAKIAGAVVLVSFLGRTTAPDLAEAQLRLAQTRVQILGTVMNNVRQGQMYNRYRYGYYTTGSTASHQRSQQVKRRLLLPIEPVVRMEGDNEPQPRAKS